MNSARRELDRMSYEAWGQLVSDVKTGSKSMGRVSLSYARRHPALLLGGGALLGLAAVSMFRRNKTAPVAVAPVAAAAPVKAHAPAWTGLLKQVLKMWLLDTLAAEFRVEQDKHAEGESDGDRDGDGERENEMDPERAAVVRG